MPLAKQAGKQALLEVRVKHAGRRAGVRREVEDGRRVCRRDAGSRHRGDELPEGLALIGREGIDVDQGLDLRVAGGGVGDDRPP
jgi:hypothetical protein